MTFREESAKGTVLAISNNASTPVFTPIPGVFNGPKGPKTGPRLIEGNHHGSDFPIKRKVGKEVGMVTFSLYWDSSDAQHVKLREASDDGTVLTFKETSQDNGAEIATYTAYVRVEVNKDPGQFVEASVELELDGDVLFA